MSHEWVRIKTEDTDEDIKLETDDGDSGKKDIKAETDDEDEALVKAEADDECEKPFRGKLIIKNIKEEETDDVAEIQTTGLSHLAHAHGKKSEKKVDTKKHNGLKRQSRANSHISGELLKLSTPDRSSSGSTTTGSSRSWLMSKVMGTYASVGLSKRRSRSYCFTNEDMCKRPAVATPFEESDADRDRGATLFLTLMDVTMMASIATMLKPIGIRFRMKRSAAIPLVDTQKLCVVQ